MFDLFYALDGIFNMISDGIQLLIRYFELAASALTYVTAVISYMPNYLKIFFGLMVSISVILLVINRG